VNISQLKLRSEKFDDDDDDDDNNNNNNNSVCSMLLSTEHISLQIKKIPRDINVYENYYGQLPSNSITSDTDTAYEKLHSASNIFKHH
jgi:hypothetical protein